MKNLKTDRTKVRRIPKRGHYDKKTIYSIIDEAMICHVGFVMNDTPYVIPTIHARIDDTLYLHGSVASQMLDSVTKSNICITMTIVDGIVLARSLFHHSMNYRSVVVLGKGNLVSDSKERLLALKAVSDHLVEKRWDDARQPSKKELKATTVIAININEASAKIRSGPPIDEEDDDNLPVWAGVVPIKTISEKPVADPKLKQGISLPEYLK
jgi:nitroimidazol reductase NimA-like FMN-containing flavoprotein (pyridoxamine 5'-phosphate oxidase superfamily)